MPIQNVGTLLENIVLLEAARLLLRLTDDSGRPLDFTNAFAMPPLSEWRGAQRYERQAAFNSVRLARLRQGADPEDQTSYSAMLRQFLVNDSGCGPNGAVLVAVLAAREGRRVRMWLNDLPNGDGHYTGAIAGLRSLPQTLPTILADPTAPVPEVSVCEQPYDSCLANLGATLSGWQSLEQPYARLGFLDPMRYTIAGRTGPRTSPADHRNWLRWLLSGLSGPAVAVHFTGNSTTNELKHEIVSLHHDGVTEGYQTTRAFKRYHYVVSVNCFHPAGEQEANLLAGKLEGLVHDAWTGWHRLLARPGERLRPLMTFADGVRR